MASSPARQVESPKERIGKILKSLDGLDAVEALVRSKFQCDAPLLSEIPEYLLSLGGKRVRPVLSLLCAKALGMETPRHELVDVAAGIELIHMATLLHDDIIDKSPLRRHEESPFLRYGTGDTLLAGDFLLVRAFSLCARLDGFIIDATERACIELTEGEILETPLNRESHTVETSLTIARKKTASLFRLSCETAAHLSVDDPSIVSRFANFGEDLGIAFQILDDVLDVTSSEALLGKKAGIDIREKKPSMINVLWLKSGSALAKRLLIEAEAPGDAEIDDALKELRGGPVVLDACGRARSYAESASRHLAAAIALVPSPNREAVSHLEALVDYVLERME